MSKLYRYTGDDLGVVNYTTPEMFGAVGDGVTDDTAAIQAVADVGGLILFDGNKTYKTTAVIRLKQNTELDLNGATIHSTVIHLFFNFLDTSTATGYTGEGNITIKNGRIIGGAISFAHAKGVLLDNIQFAECLNDHYIETAGCQDFTIRNCSFSGMANLQSSVYEYINVDLCRYSAFPHLPYAQRESAFYDNSKCDGLTVDGCKFSLGSGAYAYGYNAFGVHFAPVVDTRHTKIVLTNNEVRGFTGCGFRINDMQDVYIANNRIEADGDGIRLGDVEAVDKVIIVDNYVTSANGQKLVRTTDRYANLTVSGNTTAGMTQDF